MKKQGGTEKKNKVRGVASNISNRDTPHKEQAAKKDAFHLFAEKVRDHKDFVSRWAVLQEIQVEYFRGKDFVSFMRNHSELKDIIESDRSLEPEEIANILLKKTLIVQCDRVVKTVQPGKKKLSTFPAHLDIYNYQVFSDNDAFFVWAFVKRRPLWQTVLPFFWSFFILAVCFFPAYPNQVKQLILCPVAVRAMVFGALWILLGSRVWFFPNILAEEATIKELFQFWPQKDEAERPKWTQGSAMQL